MATLLRIKRHGHDHVLNLDKFGSGIRHAANVNYARADVETRKPDFNPVVAARPKIAP
jgi:hypothetical protein